ncbi:MAG: inorganic pyrophosphatase [Chitinophagales bacterium]|jgi:inorganic pyrophosphatase|nr:inorganic pyrophosphatase [Chitinophagales bacterium]
MKFSTQTLHPWHGIAQPKDFPNSLIAYIEITPVDTVKYEIDKVSGLMIVDRPQLYSNLVPALYGFVPKTYCGDEIATYARSQGMKVERGDGDPLDILVLSAHPITKNGILVKARPIGGIGLEDRGEADDKIIAVLENDPLYGQYKDISQLPNEIMDKFRHYFMTYKNLPNQPNLCKIANEYGMDTAFEVIRIAQKDYEALNK